MLRRRYGPVLGSSELLAGLARIRKRRRWMLALIGGFVPATLGVATIAPSKGVVFLFGAVWLVATSVVMLWASFSPCPNCSAAFFTGALTSQFWAPRCGHCGQGLSG